MPRAKAPAKKRAASKKAPAKKSPAKKAARGRGRAKKNVVTLDFTDVDAGGMMPTPDGIYTATVASAEQDVSSNGNDMIVVRYKTNIGTSVYDRFMLLPQSLWVLRTALNCMGYDTPDDEFELDVDSMVGQELGLEITNEEYEERDQPRVTGYLPMEAAEGLAGSSSDDDEDEDEDEDVDDDEQEEEDDEEEGDEDEDEDEEEEPAPKSRRKAPAKKKAAAKKKGALRAGARVTFEDDGEEYGGVIDAIEDGIATVTDDEDGEWEIPVEELTKA